MERKREKFVWLTFVKILCLNRNLFIFVAVAFDEFYFILPIIFNHLNAAFLVVKRNEKCETIKTTFSPFHHSIFFFLYSGNREEHSQLEKLYYCINAHSCCYRLLWMNCEEDALKKEEIEGNFLLLCYAVCVSW